MFDPEEIRDIFKTYYSNPESQTRLHQLKGIQNDGKHTFWDKKKESYIPTLDWYNEYYNRFVMCVITPKIKGLCLSTGGG